MEIVAIAKFARTTMKGDNIKQDTVYALICQSLMGISGLMDFLILIDTKTMKGDIL